MLQRLRSTVVILSMVYGPPLFQEHFDLRGWGRWSLGKFLFPLHGKRLVAWEGSGRLGNTYFSCFSKTSWQRDVLGALEAFIFRDMRNGQALGLENLHVQKLMVSVVRERPGRFENFHVQKLVQGLRSWGTPWAVGNHCPC